MIESGSRIPPVFFTDHRSTELFVVTAVKMSDDFKDHLRAAYQNYPVRKRASME